MTESLRIRILSYTSVLLIVVLFVLSFLSQQADAKAKVHNTTFKYGRDNNSFGNYAGSIKYKGKHYFGALQGKKNCKLKYHATLVRAARKNMKIGARPDGLCYGMCLAMALSFNRHVKPRAYVNNKKVRTFYKLPRASRFGPTNQLWDTMASFQILQCAMSKRKWKNAKWNGEIGSFLLLKSSSQYRISKSYGSRFIKLIKKRCRMNKVTILGLTDAGHATLATGIKETKKNYIIKMYDPNYLSFAGKARRHPFIKIRKKDYATTGYTLMTARLKYSRGKFLFKSQKPVKAKIYGAVIVLDEKKLLKKYQAIEWRDKYNEGLYARPSVSSQYDVRSYGRYAPDRISRKYVYNKKKYRSMFGIMKGTGNKAGEDIGQFIDTGNRFFDIEKE